VACASATACVAVGQNSTSQGVIVPINGGTPSSVRVVAGTQSLKGVACSGGTCEAVGANPPGPPGSARGVLVPIFNGTTGAVQTVPGTRILYSIACPGVTSCQAVGDDAMGEGVVATVTIQTIVSLTFDNGAISQYTLGYKQAVAPHGVSATFYINTGVIGGANHMSWSQLSAVAAAGQEIGGKTVDGTNLTTQSTSQQVAEICNDRQALLSHGLKPAGFAYPAGAFNTTLESEVQSCGYGNARTAGSLRPGPPTPSPCHRNTGWRCAPTPRAGGSPWPTWNRWSPARPPTVAAGSRSLSRRSARRRWTRTTMPPAPPHQDGSSWPT
jgi:peptidoglycan/xylan/chitin deacetylase (PgdA/CDA1 family)